MNNLDQSSTLVLSELFHGESYFYEDDSGPIYMVLQHVEANRTFVLCGDRVFHDFLSDAKVIKL